MVVHSPCPASQPHCPLPSPDEPGAVSPPPEASNGECLPSAPPAPLACHQLPPLTQTQVHDRVSEREQHGQRLRNDGEHILTGHLPCSHSSTSMLGGILRALLAMCFSKVVFPLLKDETKTRKHGISYYQYIGEQYYNIVTSIYYSNLATGHTTRKHAVGYSYFGSTTIRRLGEATPPQNDVCLHMFNFTLFMLKKNKYWRYHYHRFCISQISISA